MEPNVEIARQLIQEAVSLFILVIVLTGIYRLTTRLLAVVEKLVDKLSAQMERLADDFHYYTHRSIDRD